MAGAQVEDGPLATSYVPTEAIAVTRAADISIADVLTPYPAQLDLLGAAVTQSHIGLPLASGEVATMTRLSAGGGGLREWVGEMTFIS